MSPTTRPLSFPPEPTDASPESTPTRTASSGRFNSSARPSTPLASSMAARTARSESSSSVCVMPQKAVTASPMNLSTTPPKRSMISRQRSK